MRLTMGAVQARKKHSRSRRPPNKQGHNRRHHRHSGGRKNGGRSGGHSAKKNRENALEKAERAHFHLLGEHLQARKKYFDFFHRADAKQLFKFKRHFEHSLEKLRQFEASLAPELRGYFGRKLDGLERDTVYSARHGQGREFPEQAPASSQPQGPHFLPTQKREDSPRDREESTGTLEDYLRYKNLPLDHFEES